MKEIKLTKGKIALVDDNDYDYLIQFSWHAMMTKCNCYAGRKTPRPEGKTIFMHRELMGIANELQVDHIDHDGLNNQRSNLRITSFSGNARNTSSRKNSTSKYLGVCVYKKYIIATIFYNGRKHHIGHFKTEEDAAHAYDREALNHFGEFANLNFK